MKCIKLSSRLIYTDITNNTIYIIEIHTSGCSFTGTYTFSVSVVTGPSASGKMSGSFLTPLI